jgi:hypothetical protein
MTYFVVFFLLEAVPINLLKKTFSQENLKNVWSMIWGDVTLPV